MAKLTPTGEVYVEVVGDPATAVELVAELAARNDDVGKLFRHLDGSDIKTVMVAPCCRALGWKTWRCVAVLAELRGVIGSRLGLSGVRRK